MSRRKHTVVRVGNVTIPIYSLADGRFMPVWVENGARVKPRCKRLEKAKLKAEEAAVRIVNGLANPREKTPRVRVPELYRMLMAEKADHRLSPRYIRGLRDDLEKFSKRFPGWSDEVHALEISKYLRELRDKRTGLPLSDRRRNNIRDEIVTLFALAKEHGYLPQDKLTEAEKVKRVQLEHGPPRIYSPAQLQLIIEHVSPEWLDWICLQAFAGIRPEECGLPHVSKKDGSELSLSWDQHFLWEEKQIWIPRLISKTNRDRYVTISDTLLAWIGHHRESRGPVFPDERPDRETERLGKILGFEWINDGLRHSFASYWNSLHRNMATLKEEMGNSEHVNRRYYFNPQPEKIARLWLNKHPSQLGGNKVIQMPLQLIA